jgi:hypothetical protein
MGKAAYMRRLRVRNGSTKALMVPVEVLANVIANEQRQRNQPLSDWLGEDLAEVVEGFTDE